MDAVEYLKAKARMTKHFDGTCGINCDICSLSHKNNPRHEECSDFERVYSAEAISIVEKWAAEHPVKTRQSEFLKMFPNAELSPGNSILRICPKYVDKDLECPDYDNCVRCKKEFWLVEVEDDNA